jgi:DNA-binding PadR family transcriptional regulator
MAIPHVHVLGDRPMTATRLLVLGAVRIYQPVHGYRIRRELMVWKAEEWANLNPGSVYNALRSLTRDGLLAREPSQDQEKDGAASKVRYGLTGEGETEFQTLLRFAVWTLRPHEPEWLLAGLSFWGFLTRQETLHALSSRREQLQAHIAEHESAQNIVRESPFRPEFVLEHFHLQIAHLRGELAWAEAALERVASGAYTFADDKNETREF